MYVSLLGISGALHLGIFQQPAQQGFFSNLIGIDKGARGIGSGGSGRRNSLVSKEESVQLAEAVLRKAAGATRGFEGNPHEGVRK